MEVRRPRLVSRRIVESNEPYGNSFVTMDLFIDVITAYAIGWITSGSIIWHCSWPQTGGLLLFWQHAGCLLFPVCLKTCNNIIILHDKLASLRTLLYCFGPGPVVEVKPK